MSEQQEATAIKVPDRGSIEWYLKSSGGFVHSLIYTVQRADGVNRRRLRLAFPQVVAAIEMQSWMEAPPGFEPRYDAPEPEAS